MRKLFILISIAVLLTGCTSKNYQVNLKSSLNQAAMTEYERQNNHHKKYYSFYIDKSVSSLKSEDTYSVLKFLDNTFSMNLNVKEIIDEGHYESTLKNYDKEYLTFSHNGYYYDDQGVQRQYHVLVYEVDGTCFLIFKGMGIYFYSLLDSSQVYDVSLKMMSILKSVTINYDSVISAYSSNNEITYVKESTELFTSNVTTTTTLEEIINRNGVVDYEEMQEELPQESMQNVE